MSIDHAPYLSTLSRRGLVGLAAVAAGTTLLPGPRATAAGVAVRTGDPFVEWLDRHATPVRTSPRGPLDDLTPLRRTVRDAAVVGLGESAHGTHTQFALKHRVARYLVEELGFRTIAWEESWGSGVVLDRYVRGDGTDARTAVGQAPFRLRSQAMLDLVRWMREFNRGRPDWDLVRFLGADVLELRALQYDEIERFAAAVVPDRLPRVRELLGALALRGTPQEHLVWYKYRLTEDERQPLVAAARELHEMVRDAAASRAARRRRAAVDPDDAVLHAFALLGFYESGSAAGVRDDLRDRYVAGVVTAWHERTGHRIVYSAANAHVAAAERMVIEFPPDPPARRRLAGGLLRAGFGAGYVAVGTVFDHGDVLTGWEVDGGPRVYTVPPSSPSFADALLGRARLGDYLIDLRRGGPAEVRERLDGPASLRIMSSAYDSARDEHYAQHLPSWRAGFDALLHVRTVTATQLVQAAGGRSRRRRG
ncbi:erythromycin esterase family protein [Jiangella aurantiaca]|nr:erythromycin esterase family protein [Jiangella aurantiaca]